MISFKDRVKGVIYGTAYGDAMGAVVEKMTYSEIKVKYDRVETTMTKWWKADWPEQARLGRMRGQGIITDGYADDSRINECVLYGAASSGCL